MSKSKVTITAGAVFLSAALAVVANALFLIYVSSLKIDHLLELARQ